MDKDARVGHGARQQFGRKRNWAMSGGLLTVTAGTVSAAGLVWVVWLFLPLFMPLSVVAALSLALFYIGFFAAVFAGVAVMDALEASQSPTCVGICAGVAAGFVDLLRLDGRLHWLRHAAILRRGNSLRRTVAAAWRLSRGDGGAARHG
jgi:hypothetical protein